MIEIISSEKMDDEQQTKVLDFINEQVIFLWYVCCRLQHIGIKSAFKIIIQLKSFCLQLT